MWLTSDKVLYFLGGGASTEESHIIYNVILTGEPEKQFFPKVSVCVIISNQTQSSLPLWHCPLQIITFINKHVAEPETSEAPAQPFTSTVVGTP